MVNTIQDSTIAVNNLSNAIDLECYRVLANNSSYNILFLETNWFDVALLILPHGCVNSFFLCFFFLVM